MRFLLTATIPHETGNPGIRDGRLEQTIQSILQDVRPEVVYFGPHQGQRAMYLVVNVQDGSQIPAIAEPLFLGLNARIEWTPVFTPEELQKAAAAFPQMAQKY